VVAISTIKIEGASSALKRLVDTNDRKNWGRELTKNVDIQTDLQSDVLFLLLSQHTNKRLSIWKQELDNSSNHTLKWIDSFGPPSSEALLWTHKACGQWTCSAVTANKLEEMENAASTTTSAASEQKVSVIPPTSAAFASDVDLANSDNTKNRDTPNHRNDRTLINRRKFAAALTVITAITLVLIVTTLLTLTLLLIARLRLDLEERKTRFLDPKPKNPGRNVPGSLISLTINLLHHLPMLGSIPSEK
jgi:hypothetical protein